MSENKKPVPSGGRYRLECYPDQVHMVYEERQKNGKYKGKYQKWATYAEFGDWLDKWRSHWRLPEIDSHWLRGPSDVSEYSESDVLPENDEITAPENDNQRNNPNLTQHRLF